MSTRPAKVAVFENVAEKCSLRSSSSESDYDCITNCSTDKTKVQDEDNNDEESTLSVISSANKSIKCSKNRPKSSIKIVKRRSEKRSSLKKKSNDHRSKTNKGATQSSKFTSEIKKKNKLTNPRSEDADCSFGQVAKSVYNYDLKKCDQEFLERLFIALPQLKSIWDRIGFNTATQQERLEKFFTKMTVNISLFFL